jgi:hypothetical protein
MRRFSILLTVLVGVLAGAAPAGAFRVGHAPRPVAHNPADHLAGLDREVYDPATHCTSKPSRA